MRLGLPVDEIANIIIIVGPWLDQVTKMPHFITRAQYTLKGPHSSFLPPLAITSKLAKIPFKQVTWPSCARFRARCTAKKWRFHGKLEHSSL